MDIQSHLAMPHIPLERYTKRRHVELGESLDRRFALYLDQNFWITLRKAETGNGSNDERKLLDLIRGAAQKGRVFCPISESVFMELMKQSDAGSRLRTAQLIDELSFGISLIALDARIATELAYFVYSRAPNTLALHSLQHLVWTKLPWVLGAQHPVSTAFDPTTMLAVQKAFFDRMWSISMVDMMKTIGNASLPPGGDFDRLAATLNAGSAQHADQVKSFKAAYQAESLGVVDAVMDIMMETLSDIATREDRAFPPTGSEEWVLQRERWRKQLAVALQDDEGRRRLPSMHILACLYAAFRWDKSREFEANDFFDFHHAAAAIGYCQAFLTERSLRAVVAANNVALDCFHGCRVESGVSGAIGLLRDAFSEDQA